MALRLYRLILVYLAATVLDVETTRFGLSLGIVEANPLAVAVGVPIFMATIKPMAALLVCVVACWLFRRYPSRTAATCRAFGAFALVQLAVVVNNVVAIAARAGWV